MLNNDETFGGETCGDGSCDGETCEGGRRLVLEDCEELVEVD